MLAHFTQASEDLRRWLYSSEGLPSCYTDWLSLQQPPAASTNGSTGQPSLQFLDHAWGQIAPRVLQAGLAGMARCAMLGNAAWDEVFGRLMPKVRPAYHSYCRHTVHASRVKHKRPRAM